MSLNIQANKLGLIGIFVVCFGAATLLPGISEAGIVALIVAGTYNTTLLISVASIGNWLGSVFTFACGWCLGLGWISEQLGISASDIHSVQHFATSYGAWSGLLAWIPVIGDPLVACLGVMHTPALPTCIFMLIGKALRYSLLAFCTIKGVNLSLFIKNRFTKTNV